MGHMIVELVLIGVFFLPSPQDEEKEYEYPILGKFLQLLYLFLLIDDFRKCMH